MTFIILLNANKICKKKNHLTDFLTIALICCVFHNVKIGRGGQLSFLALFWDAVHFWEKGFALFKTEQLLLQLDLGLSKGVSLKKEWSEALRLLPWYPHVPVLPYIFLKAYNAASQTTEQDAGRQLHPPGASTACSVETRVQLHTETCTYSQLRWTRNRDLKTFIWLLLRHVC